MATKAKKKKTRSMASIMKEYWMHNPAGTHDAAVAYARTHKGFATLASAKLRHASQTQLWALNHSGKLSSAKRADTRRTNGNGHDPLTNPEMVFMREWWLANPEGSHDDCKIAAKAANYEGNTSKSYEAKAWAKEKGNVVRASARATTRDAHTETNGKPVESVAPPAKKKALPPETAAPTADIPSVPAQAAHTQLDDAIASIEGWLACAREWHASNSEHAINVPRALAAAKLELDAVSARIHDVVVKALASV